MLIDTNVQTEMGAHTEGHKQLGRNESTSHVHIVMWLIPVYGKAHTGSKGV